MIIIKNKQRKINLDLAHIHQTVEKLLEILSYQNFDLGILFTTPQQMQEYNHEYRAINRPTDILSFAAHPNLKAGERIIPSAPDDYALGDLILCPEYIAETLAQWNMSFDQRMEVLLVHGLCHLLGYDHELDEDWEVMKKEEERLQQLLN